MAVRCGAVRCLVITEFSHSEVHDPTGADSAVTGCSEQFDANSATNRVRVEMLNAIPLLYHRRAVAIRNPATEYHELRPKA